jgi:hypothetical protein
MIHSFFNALGTAAPEAEDALYTLLESNRSLLEEHGFYMFMRETTSSPRRTLSRG